MLFLSNLTVVTITYICLLQSYLTTWFSLQILLDYFNAQNIEWTVSLNTLFVFTKFTNCFPDISHRQHPASLSSLYQCCGAETFLSALSPGAYPSAPAFGSSCYSALASNYLIRITKNSKSRHFGSMQFQPKNIGYCSATLNI